MKPTKEQVKLFKSLPVRVQQMIIDGVLDINDVGVLTEAVERANSLEEVEP